MRLFPLAIFAATLLLASVTLTEAADGPAGPSTPSAPPKSKFDMMVEGTQTGEVKPSEGMWRTFYKDQQIFIELSPSQFNRDFLVITSIAQGISHQRVIGGMSWRFGDEIVWSFKKVGDKVHVIRRNPRFKARPGTTESLAVKMAYSDSILYSLPILTQTPTGGSLVDFTRVFLSDDESIGRAIGPGFGFAYDRSTFAKVKSFPSNVEIEVAAVYSGFSPLETVADSRGVQVHVHYSISPLDSSSGYRPRKADDRVGYFITASKDFSDQLDDQQFVRYINRWHLEKLDSSATLSPPKKPIIFYIEKTVPVAYRPIVKSGIEEWNKAFEKLGYANAIEVRQDPEDIDPEDRRYNFFRWITADAGFAMGPSRVNPFTGEIQDADIIFDAGFLRYWRDINEFYTVKAAQMPWSFLPQAKPDAPKADGKTDPKNIPTPHFHLPGSECTLCQGVQAQWGMAAAIMLDRGEISAPGKLPEEFLRQGLKEIVMHEVGHTLGLRHNFKASTWKTLEEIDDPKRTGEAISASVMDYLPVNIAAKGAKQGNYFSPTIGPYDYWAIEYGYKSVSDEDKDLAKIASRCTEPGLEFGTDEDLFLQADPRTNLFDLGKDPLAFARNRMALIQELIPKIVDKSVENGEGYQRARRVFGMLFLDYWRNVGLAARSLGGIYSNRDHKGDPNARPPLQVVEAGKQRESMKMLVEQAFRIPMIPPSILNYLAATNWLHWGVTVPTRGDYPIHLAILSKQDEILGELLDPATLSRLQDSEIQVPPETDTYTAAEHLRLVVDGIFSEWKTPAAGDYTPRKPLIAAYRRNLQREAIRRISMLVTIPMGATDDARTLARFHLSELDKQITAVLGNGQVKLDDYSRSHLQDCQERIRKILQANVIVPYVN